MVFFVIIIIIIAIIILDQLAFTHEIILLNKANQRKTHKKSREKEQHDTEATEKESKIFLSLTMTNNLKCVLQKDFDKLFSWKRTVIKKVVYSVEGLYKIAAPEILLFSAGAYNT